MMAGQQSGIKLARECTDELVQHFYHTLLENTGITPSEVTKGGSLGQGTAVPGKFDLDIVIYTKDLSTDQIMQKSLELTGSPTFIDFGYWLGRFDGYLEKTLKDRYKKIAITRYAIKFKYRGVIEVDLLISPWWGAHGDFYQFLKTIKSAMRPSFAMCASKWQTHYFQNHVDEKAKEFVKRAKAWRNKMWALNPEGFQPKSFMLSLLVVSAYNTAKAQLQYCKKPEKVLITTQKILVQRVHNHHKMNIIWDKCRNPLPPYYHRRDCTSLLPSRPRILDPINPSSNLYNHGFKEATPIGFHDGLQGKWGWMVRNIRTLDLSKAAGY